MENNRTLRSVEAWSTDQMYVYACDACLWITQASPDTPWRQILSEFEAHDCADQPLRRLAVGKVHDKGDDVDACSQLSE